MGKEIEKILNHPIDRRTFLKAVGAGTAAVLFGGQAMMEKAFAASPASVGIVQLGTCGGCQVSLAEFGMDLRYISSTNPTFADILPTIDIKFAPLLVDALDETFANMSALDICIVEGIAGPTVEASELLSHARAISTKVIALGDCASYGGVPGLNMTKKLLNLYPINQVISVNDYIRGCPPQPEHIWYIVTGGAVGEAIIPGKVCDACIYKDAASAKQLGIPGCKKDIGCKGVNTPWRCGAVTRSTAGKAPCTATNDLCIGCYENTFPSTPFYK